jgi:hypothetical protein
MTAMQRRQWVPDVAMIADQLIEDYRNQEQDGQGDLDALATMEQHQGIARGFGDDFRELDWLALVQELARRAAG